MYALCEETIIDSICLFETTGNSLGFIPFPTWVTLEINLGGWASNVGAPVVFVDRIFFVDIQFEELIVDDTSEVLVTVAESIC